MKQTLRTTIFQVFLTILGSLIYALAVNLFLQPNNIVTGGLTGVAILIHHYLPRVGIGLMVIAMNVPLFLASWRIVGHRFMLMSLLGMGAASALIDATSWVAPVDTEPLMAAMAGGLMMGAGLGLVLRQGASTGGSDVIARLIRRRFPHMRMGMIVLMVDVVVIAASMVVFRSINSGLYAILAIYLSSRMIDLLLYGTDVGRVAYIISDKNNEITQVIGETLQRGVTYLSGEGAYTNEVRRIILCAIKRQQIPTLKKLVKDIDPRAFIILTVAHEVLGEGFDQLTVDH